MADKIQFRRDTAARWAEVNPILLSGEIGLVTDSVNKYKLGDGVHTWNELPLQGFNGNLVDIPGTDTDSAMSQKGATDLVSEYNVSANNNNAEYTFAQAVALVPASLQKGGLTIKYIDSTTHKYAIKRLMSSTWNTTESNWQGIDNEPTAESNNLVKSGGVYEQENLTGFSMKAYIENLNNSVNLPICEELYLGKLYNNGYDYDDITVEIQKGDVLFVKYNNAVVGTQFAIGIIGTGIPQQLIPGNGYVTQSEYESTVISNIDASVLRIYRGFGTFVAIYKFTKSTFLEDLKQPIQKSVNFDKLDSKVINPDGTISDISSNAWGVIEISVNGGEEYEVFSDQYPDSPYVSIQVLNNASQVVLNYYSTDIEDNRKVVSIDSDGTLRVGVRISDGYSYYIKKLVSQRELLESIGIPPIEFNKKNINYVGMSIWWYDKRTLGAGVGGGVIAKGYQTILNDLFGFKSNTGTKYCYSGYSLGAKTVGDSSAIINKMSNWDESNSAIWTLDTITNDFKRDIPIGTFDDYTNNTGGLTYYGALRLFKDKVIQLSGNNAIVVVSNALHRNNSGYTSTSQNANGNTLIDFEKALMRVALENKWWFVDQFRQCGVVDDTLGLVTLDGLHLNNLGYKLAVIPWVNVFKSISSI